MPKRTLRNPKLIAAALAAATLSALPACSITRVLLSTSQPPPITPTPTPRTPAPKPTRPVAQPAPIPPVDLLLTPVRPLASSKQIRLSKDRRTRAIQVFNLANHPGHPATLRLALDGNKRCARACLNAYDNSTLHYDPIHVARLRNILSNTPQPSKQR